MRAARGMLLGLVALGCGGGTDPPPVCDRPQTYEKSPGPALEGAGWHRIYVQGASSSPDADGRFAMNEDRVLIEASDHFLLSPGAYVEWWYPLIDPLGGEAFLHIARTADEGVTTGVELSHLRGDDETTLLTAEDTDDGGLGYVPFEACLGIDAPAVEPGDALLLRITNLTGGMLGVVTRPPDYFTWIELLVE